MRQCVCCVTDHLYVTVYVLCDRPPVCDSGVPSNPLWRIRGQQCRAVPLTVDLTYQGQQGQGRCCRRIRTGWVCTHVPCVCVTSLLNRENLCAFRICQTDKENVFLTNCTFATSQKLGKIFLNESNVLCLRFDVILSSYIRKLSVADTSGIAHEYLPTHRDELHVCCLSDYDRINFCRKDVQLKYFDQQFAIAEETRLPLFLHCRSASKDLLSVLNKNRDKFTTGVVRTVHVLCVNCCKLGRACPTL